jgi:hypothetical protein
MSAWVVCRRAMCVTTRGLLPVTTEVHYQRWIDLAQNWHLHDCSRFMMMMMMTRFRFPN